MPHVLKGVKRIKWVITYKELSGDLSALELFAIIKLLCQ